MPVLLSRRFISGVKFNALPAMAELRLEVASVSFVKNIWQEPIHTSALHGLVENSGIATSRSLWFHMKLFVTWDSFHVCLIVDHSPG